MSSTTTTGVCIAISPASLLSTTIGVLSTSVNFAQADMYARNALAGVKLSSQEIDYLKSVLAEAAKANLITAELANVENELTTEQLQTIATMAAMASIESDMP